jgi:hypothetical protein
LVANGLLLTLSLLLLGKGSLEFFKNTAGQDFRYRWSAEQYVLDRVDPFPLAFWTDEHKSMPPWMQTTVWSRIQDPVNVVDPPWVFAFGLFLFPSNRELAPYVFLLLNYVALGFLAMFICRLHDSQDPKIRVFLTSIFLANIAFSQQIINGNLGIFAVAASAGFFVLLRSNSGTWLGLPAALAQVKMTIGAPLGVILFACKKWRAAVLAVVVLMVAALWTCAMVRVSFPVLAGEMLEGVNRFSTGGTNFYKVFMLIGLQKKMALVVCSTLILAITMLISHKYSGDVHAQMAIFAVCARIVTYHNVIDNVVIGFLVIAAAHTWIECEMSPGLGVLVGALVASLLIPGSIGNTATVQASLQVFWVGSLAVVLRSRRRLPILAAQRLNP